MSNIYNIYCDESCHLENDGQKAMVLGAIWCPMDRTKGVAQRIKEIKQKHGLKKDFEIKWTKISPNKSVFYLDIIDYFFDDDDLHFRCLVVPDKKKLNHKAFKQTHEEWYYKIYFETLRPILSPDEQYKIYLDIKDTRGSEKIKKLCNILRNNIYDFRGGVIKKVQLIRSHETGLLQLCDLLTGAMSYLHRELKENEGKLKVIERIQERSGYSLKKSTLIKENKFNILIWRATSSVD